MVAKIVKAAFPGHTVVRPAAWRSPYIFACPHAGRDYPERFLDDSILHLPDLRRSEDAYVDELLSDVNSLGVPVLTARFPRVFVDVNRHEREIDPQMFTTSPSEGAEIKSNRVMAGFGVIPRLAAEGRPIYAKRLPASEAHQRLRWCYRPYHEALQALIEECRTRFGVAFVIDWHSMPSASVGGGQNLPNVVLGDRYGMSCGPTMVNAWQQALADEGLTVSRNAPYAGGHVTSLYGQPAASVHVLQIELNRSLYMHEAQVRPRPARFDTLRDRLKSAAVKVIDAASPLEQSAAE
ncbi:N-formylglutamate amidohydrolase [Parvularcula sp. LCG005]|uniref:N-formylglutamate amidohydrolase n=1 Tax=Parvularcula sp. LCG005 TaxID=3078805 RepID=UPI002942988D|nr:N-formylglutamate amidohydrolase [Parvularcula sp. LCG005]WOI54093.1 N-formylglutamate amidohydrolase [Parvularcula sp. LCG005]